MSTWLVTGGAYKFHIHKGSILSIIYHGLPESESTISVI